jgi:hypothetical protein
MNWLNLRTSRLRDPAFIGSDPVARGTWLCVIGYCVELENGGRIVGAKRWKDRQWQQACGVTLKEVNRSEPILSWDGEDLIVWEYPSEKEKEVAHKREVAKSNGQLGGRPRLNPETNYEPTSVISDNQRPKAEGERKGKEKGNRKEVEDLADKPPSDHSRFIDDWCKYYEARTKTKYAFQDGRDGKAVKLLLGHFGGVEAAKAFIKSVHSRAGTGFPFATVDTLSDLANNISRLQAALAIPRVNGSNGSHATAPQHNGPETEL